ncbi:hypothetical protein PSMK_02930 [Phycisphaera mikurensis NBRC 102666]|uniref:Uncharacterized protein n=1 Tax=Phycisphaera mikurensis (strain NBRC 102666 / KCTC 22515 / FYK2301M01) TaxID=1142394 RepID=I0IB14_PHYMF|nr:hypothetical protein PSMK_02930 [Phycisphaera mikurensis NBRC 102666]
MNTGRAGAVSDRLAFLLPLEHRNKPPACVQLWSGTPLSICVHPWLASL